MVSQETQQVTQMDIVNMLRKGAFNEAFQTALSARNLELVVKTCEMVNPCQIFSQTPCPLSQSVLLSLIQQLGKTHVSLLHAYPNQPQCTYISRQKY